MHPTILRDLLIAVGFMLLVSACQTRPTPAPVAGVTPIVINPSTLPVQVGQVQAKVIAACGFQPTAQTVIAIARTFSPTSWQTAADYVSQAVAGICAAANGGVYAALSKSKSATPRGVYRGVRVRGRFVAQPK